MTVPKRIAKLITSAMRDAALARQSVTDPAFRKNMQKDRRATLREFETVEQALKDRARIELAKAAPAKRAGAAKAKKPR